MSDFVDRARAEAGRRWPGPNIVMPSGWHEKGMVSGFVLGALMECSKPSCGLPAGHYGMHQSGDQS